MGVPKDRPYRTRWGFFGSKDFSDFSPKTHLLGKKIGVKVGIFSSRTNSNAGKDSFNETIWTGWGLLYFDFIVPKWWLRIMIDDADPEYTARMLADIEGLLRERRRANRAVHAARGKQAEGTASNVDTKHPNYVSPYTVEPTWDPNPLSGAPPSPIRKAPRRMVTVKPTTDEILDVLYNTEPIKHPIDSEEIQIRSRIVNIDSRYRIEESNKITDRMHRMAEEFALSRAHTADLARSPSPNALTLRPSRHPVTNPDSSPTHSTVQNSFTTPNLMSSSSLKQSSSAHHPTQLLSYPQPPHPPRPYPNHLTADYLRKRYPRFFSCMKLGEYNLRTPSRTRPLTYSYLPAHPLNKPTNTHSDITSFT